MVRVFNESHHFSSQQDRFTKTQQPIRFQGLFKGTNHIAEKWKTFFLKFFFYKFKPAQYCINKILVQT